MTLARPLVAILSMASLAFSAPAWAQPRLLVADPAQGAAVVRVSRITLTFSEPLVAELSGVDVVMTAMPGMEQHSAMKMTGVRVAMGPDGKTLVASLSRPLPIGSYEANWHAVSADNHRVTGKLAFDVK